MTCGYCGSRIGEGEHRCRRCGRTPGDTPSLEVALHRTDGALAAQTRFSALPAGEQAPAPDASLAQAVQRPLFYSTNVIPFPAPRVPARRKSKTDGNGKAGSRRRGLPVSEDQGRLDFLPAETAKPRTLDTSVEAVIFCDFPVASRVHRMLAGALDASMVIIGYGLLLLSYRLAGGQFAFDETGAAIFAGAFLLVALTYGALWAVAGTETAGMRWTRLRLVTFDGYPLDMRQRLLRFAGSTLSICTAVGLLWSLADEETLAWQDHISRTFPTPRDSESRVFRRR